MNQYLSNCRHYRKWIKYLNSINRYRHPHKTISDSPIIHSHMAGCRSVAAITVCPFPSIDITLPPPSLPCWSVGVHLSRANITQSYTTVCHRSLIQVTQPNGHENAVPAAGQVLSNRRRRRPLPCPMAWWCGGDQLGKSNICKGTGAAHRGWWGRKDVGCAPLELT